MDNLSELQKVWHSASTDNLPQAGAMVRMVKRYRIRKLLRAVWVIAVVLFSLVFLVLKTVDYRSAMWTTRLGALFIVLAGLALIVAKLSTFVRFYRLKDCSTKDFILFLERTRERQHFFYKRTQVVCFAVCSAGTLLYLFEGVRGSAPRVFLGAYGALIAYFSILWFFARPRVFKRQERKMQEKIAKLEGILKQMENFV